MVFKGTTIGILDNTGIQTMQVLQVPVFSHGRVGDILLAVLRKRKKLKSVVKKKIHFVFLLMRKKSIFRKKGFYYLSLLKNRGVVLSPDKEKILGTRHSGYLTFESKKTAFTQLLRTSRCLV